MHQRTKRTARSAMTMMAANEGPDILSQLERFKESFLWAAAKGGRVEECESLVQMGTDVNWVSPEGDTPLLAACRNGHVPAALCLLSHGASVNQAAKDGQTALHLSCRRGKEAVAEALILRGADIFARDNGGVTALESHGPHVPDDMLRRLNTVAQRNSRQQHHHGASLDANTTSNPPSGAPNGERRTPNSAIDAENLSAFTGVERRGSNECIRVGLRRGSNSHYQQYHRINNDVHDGAGGVRPAATTGGGGRSEAQWGAGSRTTFPAISRTTGSNNTGSRQSPSFMLAGNAGSGNEGFHSSDDDELLHEDETGIRLLGGGYRGPGARQQGAIPTRNRSGGSDGFPENMHLISAGNPVPHASAAIAAAIASAAVSSPPTAATTTIADPLPFATTSADTEATTSSSLSPRQSFDIVGAATVPWDGAGADGGGGHGIVVSNNSTSSSSSSRSSSSNGFGSGRSSGSGGRESEPEIAAATAASIATTPSTSATIATTGVRDSLATNSAEETAGRLGTSQGEQLTGADVRGGYGSGNTPFTTMDSRGSALRREMERCSRGQAEGKYVSNDHVGLIRVLWLQEKESRLASEAKAEAVREQSARLWNELVRSEKQVLSLEKGAASLREERDKLKDTLNGEGFKGRSLPELEQLEKGLRKALEGVCGERDRIVQEQLAKEEQRLCVVCQEKERGVLLLPCRHLCICRNCSERRELTLCPLCRNHIVESLVVYS